MAGTAVGEAGSAAAVGAKRSCSNWLNVVGVPAATVAGGKVLIAWLSEDELRSLYPSGIPRLTPRTTTDPESLAVEFEEIRRRGYALNRDGSYFGLSAIGAPIRMPDGTVAAAIAISTRSERMTNESIHRVLGPMLASAAAIAAELQARTASSTA